jgi:hypothetical protein
MKHKYTQEDKVAEQFVKAVDTLSLDLDRVGVIIAHISTNLIYNRLEVVLESAKEEKERLSEREKHDYIY